ncbi:alpha/beta hydrolase [Paenibacillus sp. VMFN-D1]|uniref:alpha/beta hydrolase n=1 Tax=Paenibacillus sp. VMFN-D1 TaxID=2135608 RepID=UPI000E24815A|nr:alpha/beta hydrolase [Paenibacillus sp. VMFN-D1]RED41832.1 acetyl esterase/lipase [Paenibacillus sp. VMFN-D1]
MKSYSELVRQLQEKAVQVERDGYTFITKPIPDSSVGGELDPRVYLVQKQTTERMKQSGPFQMPEDPLEFAKLLRGLMGWDNDDVTDGKVSTESRIIEGTEAAIPIRIYTPQGAKLRPAIVFFHGGGFIGGSVDVVENPCKCLALHADAVVVSVDYRLAPECPYPAGITDSFDAVRWVYEHADELQVNRSCIATAGDSAGGNLAAVCAMMDRDQRLGMIKYQVLIYPTVNRGAIETEDFKWSIDQYDIRNHHEYILPGINGMRSGKISDIYLQGMTDITDPYVSPLLGDLRGLPAALIVAAEYDYLRIENEAYARKLARSGVDVTLVQYKGTDHAFMDKLGLYPQAEDCLIEAAKGFKHALTRLNGNP